MKQFIYSQRQYRNLRSAESKLKSKTKDVVSVFVPVFLSVYFGFRAFALTLRLCLHCIFPCVSVCVCVLRNCASYCLCLCLCLCLSLSLSLFSVTAIIRTNRIQFRCSTFIVFNLLRTEIDECKENTDNCSANAQCHNTPGSFNCTCNTGFIGDGVNCTIGKKRPENVSA